MYLISVLPALQVLVPVFFNDHLPSKSAPTLMVSLDLGETSVTVQAYAAVVGGGGCVQGMKTRVGVEVGAGVSVGAGVLVGEGVSLGTVAVAVGAFWVRLAMTVSAACVDTASRVGW